MSPSHTPLAFQEITLSDFLEPFFSDYTEAVHVRALKPRGAPNTPEFQPEKISFTREQLENDYSVWKRLEELNATRGLYFVVNAGGDADAEITRYTAIFCESDDRPLQEQHRLYDVAPLPPSIRVETKKSVHAYWLLSGECPEDEWRDLQQRLIEHFKSDEKIKNPSRVMRLPFFNHVGWAETGVETRRVRLVQFEPGRRYTADDLRRAFPRAGTQATTEPSAPARYTSWEQLSTELKSRIMRHPTARMQKDGWWHCKGVCHAGRGDSAVMFNPASGAVKCMAGCEYRDLLVAFGLPDRPSEPSMYFGSQQEAKEVEKSEADEARDTLVWSWGAIKHRAFEEGEKIIATLERGECGLLVAYPNAGKTTLCMNVALSLITGRSFEPLTVQGAPPRRVLVLDAETSWARFQRDVWTMTRHFTDEELSLIDDNLHAICEAELGGDAVQLSDPTHLGVVARAAASVQPDLIIIDTLSQFFTLFDENSNAEVSRKVWRPLQKLARVSRAAVLVVHHLGKKGDSSDAPAVYAGRGASSSGGAARFMIALSPVFNAPDTVTLKNTKAKGEAFEDVVLRLDREARWFSAVPPKREQQRDRNRDLVLSVITEELTANGVARKVEGLLSRPTVFKYLRELYEAGEIVFNNGQYGPLPNASDVEF